MIKSGVGISNNSEPRQAGKEACQKAMASIEKTELIIVFASSEYDQTALVESIAEAASGALVIGCSDAGEITSEGSNKGGVAVMALSADNIDFIPGFGGNIADGARMAGKRLAEDINKKAEGKISAYLVLSDVLKGNGADIVRGIQDVAGKNAFIIGGAAGDDFQFKETFVYLDGKAYSSSLIGVGLSGDFSMGVGVRHGWTPIGIPKKVTKSNGAVLEELDGKPAISIYEENFGKRAQELREEPLAVMAITYPLGMKIEENDELLIRDPITVDEFGAITCAAEIPEGTMIQMMIGSKDEAISAAKVAAKTALDKLDGKTPKLAIMFNCIARSKLFGRHADEEIKVIRSIIGENVPLIGFYTYGELAPFNTDEAKRFSCFHNETAVIMVIGE